LAAAAFVSVADEGYRLLPAGFLAFALPADFAILAFFFAI
jgi:hypothetical protein